MELTCIMCPVGCTLEIKKVGKNVTVTGNGCPRGEEYGKKEVTKPERIVTTLKKYKNGTICLKTDKPIPKKLVDKCLKTIKDSPCPKKAKVGEIYIKNILDTTSNIVITSVNE